MNTSFGGFGGFGGTASPTNTSTPATTTPTLPPIEHEIDQSTPWVAASDGDLPLLQKSLQALDLPHTCADSNGLTPMHSAASYGHVEIVRWILSRDGVGGGIGGGQAVNARDTDGDTPLHHCDDAGSARVLVEEGSADYTLKNGRGETVLEMKERELVETMADAEEGDSDDEAQGLVNLIQYLQALVNGDNMQGGEGAMET